MNTPNTCEIRKNVLFIMTSAAFDGDKNYQTARMALSLSMDANPHLLIGGNALSLTIFKGAIHKPLHDFYEQARFLVDMEIPIYVLEEDLQRNGYYKDHLRPEIKAISSGERSSLLEKMHFVITT
jgi:hypothetical protein